VGYNQRNDEIRDNVERMWREREAYSDALATVEQFNGRLSAKKSAWFWPTIAAALASKHHWLIIACDSCGTVIGRTGGWRYRVARRLDLQFCQQGSHRRLSFSGLCAISEKKEARAALATLASLSPRDEAG
jgi:hypothetical protein